MADGNRLEIVEGVFRMIEFLEVGISVAIRVGMFMALLAFISLVTLFIVSMAKGIVETIKKGK